jgi:hypothetical protein
VSSRKEGLGEADCLPLCGSRSLAVTRFAFDSLFHRGNDKHRQLP